MGTFTLQLKEVIESLYGETMDEDDYEQPYESCTFDGITYGKLPTLPDYRPLGLGDYPIFDEGYRKILNGKIIEEFYNQEICTETIDNFVLILRKKMNQIMPYYNKLYLTEQIDYSALDSMKIHSVGSSHIDGSENGSATNSTTSDAKTGSRVIGSDFPQTQLAGNADYATNGSDVNSETNTTAGANQTTESANNSNSNSDTLVTGYQGAASDLITKYRNTLLNIDTMILADLDGSDGCFMLVLNNGDEYFARDYYGGY